MFGVKVFESINMCAVKVTVLKTNAVPVLSYSWRGSCVTVKELQIDNMQQHGERHAYHDLLITELNFCW